MRTVMSDCLTEDLNERLKNEKSCFLSSNKEWWLFTDMNIFDKISKEYNLNKVYTHSVEEYLQIIYEDEKETFMGKEIQISAFIESTMEAIEGEPEKIYCNGWDKILDKYIKINIAIIIANDLKDELNRLKNSDYNVDILKNIIK